MKVYEISESEYLPCLMNLRCRLFILKKHIFCYFLFAFAFAFCHGHDCHYNSDSVDDYNDDIDDNVDVCGRKVIIG